MAITRRIRVGGCWARWCLPGTARRGWSDRRLSWSRPGCATMRPCRGKATATRSASTRSPRRARTSTVRPDFVSKLSPASVLDAGCGTGRVAIELARRGVPVVGVDRDASMLATARSRGPSVTWIQADLTTLDLGQVFDLVVMAGNVPLFTPPGHPGRAGRRRSAPRRPGWGDGRRVPARPGLRARRVRRATARPRGSSSRTGGRRGPGSRSPGTARTRSRLHRRHPSS